MSVEALGVLVLDKPAGISSAAAVHRVKRALGARRAGHAGTLDPMATGVLVVCVGEATKIATYLLLDDKCYLATARLGEATDTWDADGTVVERAAVAAAADEQVRQVLSRFVGRIEQEPPVFSAIKQAGQPLYRRARRGETVAAPVRTVEVESIELIAWTPPELTFRVVCGKGTYVRSLAVDIARALGTVAHLTALRRERSGPFGLPRAVAWSRVQGAADDPGALSGALAETLIAPAEALAGLPRVTIDPPSVTAIGRGQPIVAPGSPVAGPVCLTDSEGILVAMGQWRDERIWPVRVLRAAVDKPPFQG